MLSSRFITTRVIRFFDESYRQQFVHNNNIILAFFFYATLFGRLTNPMKSHVFIFPIPILMTNVFEEIIQLGIRVMGKDQCRDETKRTDRCAQIRIFQYLASIFSNIWLRSKSNRQERDSYIVSNIRSDVRKRKNMRCNHMDVFVYMSPFVNIPILRIYT